MLSNDIANSLQGSSSFHTNLDEKLENSEPPKNISPSSATQATLVCPLRLSQQLQHQAGIAAPPQRLNKDFFVKITDKVSFQSLKVDQDG